MEPAAKTDSVDMWCQIHAVTGDNTSVESCNTSCNPSWASPEWRQQLRVVVFRCKQMFMGDWLIINQVISFLACIKLEWRFLIREIEHIRLLSQQVFLDLRCISLFFQRYDCTVTLRLRKHFRNRLYLKNNSISPFVLSSSTPVCIWPFSIAIISYDSVPYAWKGITQKIMFLLELWWYHIASLFLCLYLLLTTLQQML